MSKNIATKINSSRSDIKALSLGKRYDVVLALFHVISYMPKNDDIEAVFNGVKEHLNEGGLFIFDCWYGPGVISDLPGVRIKKFEDESVRIKRTSEPEIHPNENLVDVKYCIDVFNKKTSHTQKINELHRMRYLFGPEIELFLKMFDMNQLALFNWMTTEKADFSSWNAVFIAQTK